MKVPSGNITFLFTDIEGSTKLAQDFPETIHKSLEKHNAILHKAIESNNGYVFEIVGDAFCSSFENSWDAIKAAYEIQISLSKEEWDDFPVKVRIGIHSGPAEWNGGRYMGYITLARTQRVMSAAYGDQILLSDDVYISAVKTLHKGISYKDLGERRLKDLIQPIRIYQLVSNELRSEFPPLKTLDARPNNLPVQLTSFIGREKEINEIKNILDHTHLLTLAGPGGTGKTRLCLQAAADLIDNFDNGVWFMDLASLKDETLLFQTISCALGIKEKAGVNLLTTIIDFLRDKKILLLLDNCEHIIVHCSRLAEKLLSRCPELKIIATSREALRCRGEIIYFVTALEIPDINSDISLEKQTQYESVKFFIERAIAVQPDFQVDNITAPYVAEICYKLDGIPLAIELAAARVKVLSVQQINERLENRFKLLVSGKRTALPRQQTLRALIDWSYDLLSENEKILWKRLSVFTGGWTIDSAEKICSDQLINEEDILDLVSQLIDKSIVYYNSHNDRYNMLETIRQYGEEKLDPLTELDVIMMKHLDYYMELAETAKKFESGSEQKKWMDKLDEESSNLQVALMNSIIRDARKKGIRIVIALCRYWEVRGYISQTKQWLKEFLNSNEEIDLTYKANLLQWSGTFEWISGNYPAAKKFYEESYEINKQLDNKKSIGVSLNNLSLIYNITGEYERSRELSEQSHEIFKESGDKLLIADSLLNLGATLINLDELDKAQEVFEDCLKQYREIGDERSEGMILTNLGALMGLKKQYESARSYYEEGLELQNKLQDKRTLSVTLGNLGTILGYLNEFEKAVGYLESSIKLNTEIGNKKDLSDSFFNMGFTQYQTGNIDKAIYYHKEGLKLKIELSDETGICICLIGIAEAISGIDPENTVCMLGAIHTASGILNRKLSDVIEEVFNQIYTMLRKKIGKEKFEDLFNEGKNTDLNKVIEMAFTMSNEQ